MSRTFSGLPSYYSTYKGEKPVLMPLCPSNPTWTDGMNTDHCIQKSMITCVSCGTAFFNIVTRQKLSRNEHIAGPLT
jgi:hypothetical protein